MNTVPFNFSQRVLATYKCCDVVNGCGCPKPQFAARKWNQPEQPSALFNFHFGTVNGKWKYGFSVGNSDEIRSVDELMKSPHMKNTRVCRTIIWEADSEYLLKYNVVDVEKLLNFVSSLANEPELHMDNVKSQFFDSLQGQRLLVWLEERWFSHIYALAFLPIYFPVLEKQFSRRKATQIDVQQIAGSEEFLEKRLKSGDLKRFTSRGPYEFSSTLLKHIIWNVLEEPEDYDQEMLDICARFDDSAKEVMDEFVRMKLCRRFVTLRKDCELFYRYVFDKQTPVLFVDKFPDGVRALYTSPDWLEQKCSS